MMDRKFYYGDVEITNVCLSCAVAYEDGDPWDLAILDFDRFADGDRVLHIVMDDGRDRPLCPDGTARYEAYLEETTTTPR